MAKVLLHFACPSCGKRTTYSLEQNPFGKNKVCKECGQSFALKKSYLVKTSQAQLLTFSCPYCAKTTSYSKRQKPFGKEKICKGCGERYLLLEKFLKENSHRQHAKNKELLPHQEHSPSENQEKEADESWVGDFSLDELIRQSKTSSLTQENSSSESSALASAGEEETSIIVSKGIYLEDPPAAPEKKKEGEFVVSCDLCGQEVPTQDWVDHQTLCTARREKELTATRKRKKKKFRWGWKTACSEFAISQVYRGLVIAAIGWTFYLHAPWLVSRSFATMRPIYLALGFSDPKYGEVKIFHQGIPFILMALGVTYIIWEILLFFTNIFRYSDEN